MNPTTNQQAVRMKVESAVAAFLRNFYDVRADDPTFDKSQLDVLCRRPNTVVAGLPVYEGQTPLQFAMPCLVVNVTRSSRMTADADAPWSEVTVEIHVMTQIEEGNEGTDDESVGSNSAKYNAAKDHAERSGFIVALMDDQKQVMTSLNVRPDDSSRPVKSLTVFGYWMEGEASNQWDLFWDDVYSYVFHCSPLDPGLDIFIPPSDFMFTPSDDPTFTA